MAGKKIGLVLALDGEKEFAQAVQTAQKNANLFKTELKNLAKQFEGNANSIDALKAKQEALTGQQVAYKQKLEQANKGLDKANENYNKQGKRIEELKQQLEDAQKALQKMNEAGDTSSDAYAKQAKSVDDLSEAVKKQELAQQKELGSIADWNKKVIESKGQLNEVNKALDQNEKYLKEAETATDKCATSIDEFGKEVKETGSNLDDAGKKTSTFKQMLAANLTGTAIVNGLKAVGGTAKEAAEYAIEVGSSFEEAMSQVEAISGASGSELDALAKKAKEMGSSTKFSATEAANAFQYMSLAGWDTQQSLSGIDGILSLAAASGMELAAASDMVTDYLSAFGMEAEDASYMADMLASAQAASNTTAEMLGEAYKNCAANMHSAGQDIETTTSLLEAMANQGLKGSEAGTALTAIMRDITQKMSDGKIAIGSASVAVQDANGDYRDLTDILTDVEAATNDLGSAQKNEALMSTFTSDSLKGLNTVFTEGMDKVSGYEDALRNSSGAAAEMAEIMQDNLKGDLTTMGSALEGLGIATYNYIEGPVRGVVQGVTGIITGITEIITPQKDALEQLVDNAKATNEQLDATVKNADGIISSAENEASKIGILGEQLISLNGIEEKSVAQKQMLRSVVDELGQSIPEIAAAYDEEAGSVALTDEQIQNLVSSTRDLMVAQAMQKAGQEVINELVEAGIALEEARGVAESARTRISLLEKEKQMLFDLNDAYNNGEIDGETFKTEQIEFWTEALEKGRITLEEFDEATAMVGPEQFENRLNANIASMDNFDKTASEAEKEASKLGKAYNEADQKAQNFMESSEELKEKISGSSEAIKQNSDAVEENADAAAKTAEEVQEAANSIAKATGASAEAQKEAAQSILDTYHGYVDEIKSDLQDKINPFEKFDTKSGFGDDATVESMTQNLDSQIEAFENYQKSLEAVKDHVGKEISPEFMQYLENMGIEGKNTLDHILATYADEEPEKVKELNDKWTEVMNLTESMAEVGAANKIAFEAAMGELGSSDVDFSELRSSIDKAVDSAAEGWADLPEATELALEQTIQAAQECGIKIPDGLAEGIASGETSPQEAIAQLKGSIQGTFEGLSDMAKKVGVDIPPEIAEGVETGGQDAVDAISRLVQLISGKSPELKKAIEDGTKTDGVKTNVESSVKSGADAITDAKSTYQENAKGLGTEIATGIEESAEQIGESVRNALQSGADAICEQKDTYKQAGEELGNAVSKGLQESLEKDSGSVILNPESISSKIGEYQSAGSALGSAVVAGLQEQQKAINDALSPDAGSITNKAKDYSSAGQELGAALADGMKSKESDTQAAGSTLSDAAISAIRQQISQMQAAGQQQAQTYVSAISAARSMASGAGESLGSGAYSGAAAWQGSFYSVGVNMASGVASGINAGSSSAVSAAISMASRALSAAKQTLGIHSPSKVFKEQVGKQVGTGFAFGIKDSASLASKQATLMSQKVYKNATSWLNRYKKKQKISLVDEQYYWEQVLKHVKKGTNAYNEATKKLASVNNKLIGDTLNNQIGNNFGVSWYETTGTGENAKTVQKSAADYYSEIYNAAKKSLDNYKIIHDTSLEQEMAYWKKIKATMQTGTQAWYDATETINNLKDEIKKRDEEANNAILANAEKYINKREILGNISTKSELNYWKKKLAEVKKNSDAYYEILEKINNLEAAYAEEQKQKLQTRASVQDSILSNYKTYYKVSTKAEAEYWNTARKQFKKGTQERIEADQKYFDALQNLYDQRKELDEDYAEKSKEINDDLKESVEELQKAYKDAVASRKQDILSSMNLFESWDSSGYDADTLIYNLKTQVAGLTLWEQKLEELKQRGISTDLYEYLAEQGPDAAANIYSLAEATDEQLKEYQNLFDQRNALANSQAVKDNENLLKETNSQITQLKKDAQKELNALNKEYKASLAEINETISSDLKKLVKKAGSIGEDAVAGLVAGIDKASDSVDTYKSSTKVVKKISSELTKLKSEGEIIGKNTLDGILEGLMNQKKIEEAAQKTVNSIKYAMQEAAEIHSPSRLFENEVGFQISAGVGEGVEGGSVKAISSAQRMMQDTLAAAKEEMEKQQSALQEQMSSLSLSGISRLNHLTEQYSQQPTTVSMDDSSLSSLIGVLISAVNGLADKMDNQQLVLDTGILVGQMQPLISQESADITIRRKRGKL